MQTKDGHMIPLSTQNGLLYADVRPVRDHEWTLYPQIHLTGDDDWDPDAYDYEVSDDWARGIEDPVNEHYKDRACDRFGNLKNFDDTDHEPITRAEIEANVTESIQEELVDSVVEFEVNGHIFHNHTDDYDSDMEWGDWRAINQSSWHSYNVEGRRRSSRRTRKDVNYKETSDRKTKKGDHDDPPALMSRANNGDISDDDDDHDGSVVEPRTDYNNPAKSTLQNEPRHIEGGPYAGKPKQIDFERLRRNFCGAPVNVLQKTFENATQLGRLGAVKGLKLWKRHKAPNPALNVARHNEPVATDTIYGPGCPAVDNGSTAAQFFVGRKSGFCAIEGLGRSDKRHPVALMNHIRRYGAMDQIISDNAKAQISTRVEEILNMLQIKDWTSEPHNKNLNFAERVWRDAKRKTELTLNFSDAPAFVWLLALEYVCFVMNHTAQESLGWEDTNRVVTGLHARCHCIVVLRVLGTSVLRSRRGIIPSKSK